MNLITRYEDIPDYYLNSVVFKNTYISNSWKKSDIKLIFTKNSDLIPRDNSPIINHEDFVLLLVKLDYYGISFNITIVIDYIEKIKFDYEFWEWFMSEDYYLKDEIFKLRIRSFCENRKFDDHKLTDEGIRNSRLFSASITNDGFLNIWNCGDSKIFNNTKYISLCCSFSDILILSEDGELFTWTKDIPSKKSKGWIGNTLTKVQLGYKYITIACGLSHYVALKDDGTFICWGSNRFSQLDIIFNEPFDPAKNFSDSAEIVPDYKFISIECGENHSVALREDGKIFCWGCNFAGQLYGCSSFSGTNYNFQNYNSYIKIDRTSKLSNLEDYPEEYKNNKNNENIGNITDVNNWIFVSIKCKLNYSMALRNDGNIYCWGNIFDYRLLYDCYYHGINFWQKNMSCETFYQMNSRRILILEKTISFSCGCDYFTLILENGELFSKFSNDKNIGNYSFFEYLGYEYGWEYDYYVYGLDDYIPSPDIFEFGTTTEYISEPTSKNGKFRMIFCGDSHSAAIRDDGSVICWGSNYSGQITLPISLLKQPNTYIISVFCGYNYTIITTNTGLKYFCGCKENFNGSYCSTEYQNNEFICD